MKEKKIMKARLGLDPGQDSQRGEIFAQMSHSLCSLVQKLKLNLIATFDLK
jgi:hypothetical protein